MSSVYSVLRSGLSGGDVEQRPTHTNRAICVRFKTKVLADTFSHFTDVRQVDAEQALTVCGGLIF